MATGGNEKQQDNRYRAHWEGHTQQQDRGDFQSPAEDLQEAAGLQGSTQTGRNTLKICLFYVSDT